MKSDQLHTFSFSPDEYWKFLAAIYSVDEYPPSQGIISLLAKRTAQQYLEFLEASPDKATAIRSRKAFANWLRAEEKKEAEKSA